MYTKIFYFVNSGLYFSGDNTSGLFVDAFFRGEKNGFSNTPAALLQHWKLKKEIFRRKNDLLFTHLHEDHYDEKTVECCLSDFPEYGVYGPSLLCRNIRAIKFSSDIDILFAGNYRIYSFHTFHDGKEYRYCTHRAYLIQDNSASYLVCGDARIDQSLAAGLGVLGNLKIETAFLNIYQLFNTEMRKLLNTLPINKIVLYHLPFPNDDLYNYGKLAKSCIRNVQNDLKADIIRAVPMTRIL